MELREEVESLVTEFLRRDPFSIESSRKNGDFLNLINRLTDLHLDSCAAYRRIVCQMFGTRTANNLTAVPYLPVQLFKTLDLTSVRKNDVTKTMTSSGTTGQTVSKIVLDKGTSAGQTRALAQIMKSILGPTRVPMLIIDSSDVVKNRDMFSARGAGIRGFSMFGRDITYALDENMTIQTEVIADFVERHKDETVLLFGFTFMIWEHFCSELRRQNVKFNIPNGLLLHGGGWKKLASLNIGNSELRKVIEETSGIRNIVNYYGMVEQTGSIYIECSNGYLHSSAYSDVIIRSDHDFAPVADGTDGIIQVISVLPMSYPGHSLLTEDIGVIVGRDDCSCGRPGTYFLVHGRMKDAELRGCSDTFAA